MKTKKRISLLMVVLFLASILAASTVSLVFAQSKAISGTVTYDGEYGTDHQVLVSLHANPNSEPVASVHIEGLGDYSLTGISTGTYYVSAFLDIKDREEGPPEFGEPLGWYDPNDDGTPDAVTVSGSNLTGIDILMSDIDSNYIRGTACYLGGAYGPQGRVEVGLHDQIDEEPLTMQFISLPCEEYTFSGGPSGTYYVSLFYDVDGSSGPPDPGEPFAYYDANGDGSPDPVVYNTGDAIEDIDITISGIHYVDADATGNNNGTSWEHAFTDLQDALSAVSPGEEIWVAEGVYTPGTNRSDSFNLKHDVAIYGGFDGSEDHRYQRDWKHNTTILSGEIGNASLKTDNVYHVVTSTYTTENPVGETTILDGFTITRGYAFTGSDKGGGVINTSANPTLVNLNFIDNHAENHGGAVVTLGNNDPLSIVNTTFSGNSSGANAGAIAGIDGTVAVINSTITGNSGANGGGIVLLFNSHAEIHNTILWGNPGGQIGLQNAATANVTYSIVEGGYATGTHILTDNPLFEDVDGADNTIGTLDDDLHLQDTSPAIDAGDNARVPADIADSDGDGNVSEKIPSDIDGDVRFIDDPNTTDTGNGTAPLVDIGADEFFFVEVVPTPLEPVGTIWTWSPRYKWTAIDGATKYHYRVWDGGTKVLEKYLDTSVCDAVACAHTHPTQLIDGAYKWQVQAKVDGIWQDYSSLTWFSVKYGFDSRFDTDAAGWEPVTGRWTWNVANGNYRSTGMYQKFSTSRYDQKYGVLTYEVKLRRQGADITSPYGILFNGQPWPLGTGDTWKKGYAFYLNRSGQYQIVKYEVGVPTDIVALTDSSSIKNGWYNVLKVTYNKNTGFAQFFINGTRVHHGTFNDNKWGLVGVTFYKSAYGWETLLIDSARLATSAPTSLP